MGQTVPFKPLKKTRLYEQVADQIKQAIYDGQYSPGDRLPSERDLGQIFNVGRPTVREALRTLSVMGLVDVGRGTKGARIAEADISQYMETMREQLSWMIRADKKTLEELWEVRQYIELGIAHAVAKNASDKEIQNLEAMVAKMAACGGDFEAYFPLAVDFHIQLAQMTANKVYFLIWEMIHSIVIKGYMPILNEVFPDGPAKLLKGNHIMVAAIKTRDPKTIDEAMAIHSDIEAFFDVGEPG